MPRTLVLLAHPDDEVLALGGRLERFTCSRFVCATDGSPRDGHDAASHGLTRTSYRRVRRGELHAALKLAGVPRHRASVLRLSGGSHVSDQAAAFHLAALARAVLAEIRGFRPESILTHPYEGGHPDHDACAFAVHTAVLHVRRFAPPIIEATSYHAGPEVIVAGEFLPGGPDPICRPLSPKQRIRKRDRLRCFRTQAATLSQFSTECERFRLAPVYDFTVPPHPGRLFYEQFPWGMSGERFRRLAAEALVQLRP